MTWAYFYFMKREPDRVREVAPRHAEYWHESSVLGWRGGPFADRSGGLIVFDSPDEKAAGEAVGGDPFQHAGLLDRWWLKRWEPA